MAAQFHLAIPVRDLESARAFYGALLGCREGRSTGSWVDFDFFGHQLSVHLSQEQCTLSCSKVDDQAIPIPHFGVVLEWSEWHRLAQALLQQNVSFVVQPGLRFQGLPGEQATMLFRDPSGNTLEFKAFQNAAQLFAG